MRYCITSAAAIILLSSIPAAAALVARINFDEPYDHLCTVMNASITDDSHSVIEGSKSLTASYADEGWHEFLHSREAVVFNPGSTYHVSFDYRILDPGGNSSRFYSCLKSRSGGEIYGNFWMWNREKGARGTIHRLFEIKEKDDWFLVIGVRHNGAIVIDNIEISTCEKDVPGYGLAVKPGRTDLLQRKAELDKLRGLGGLDSTLKDMLVVWCDEGAGAKIRNSTARYAQEHDPDFVDWNPCGPMAKEFGVRTSRGGPEYQEFYKMEGPEVWETRFERFLDKGFAVSRDNTLIQDETWGEGGYFTCHNGDNWHKWFIDELLKRNKDSLAICQDNIACAPFYKGHGCFCKSCLEKFRVWLESRYTARELAAFGIADVSSFNYLDRVCKYGLIGRWALGDPVTREYIKFQIVSQLAAWADVVKNVKRDAEEKGFPVPCYGNQIGAFGMWPFAVAIGEFCDVIEIEEVISVKNEIPDWSLHYKMGRASGHEAKPVWVRGPVHDANKDRTPMVSRLFWATHFAEALANGGVRDISFGINAPWTGDPSTLDYIDSPEVRQVWREYAILCHANRAVFTHRKSLAKVALVYSLPTTMFRRYYPLDIDGHSFFGHFDETARWLNKKHIPYDCVVFGHSEVFPTPMEQLKQYDVLVIPPADALSDVQIAFLRKFAENGGKIIKIGDIGTLDENLNPRDAQSRLSISHLVDLEKERDRALKILESACGITTNAPETITTNLWLSAGGGSVDLHLVNYGANLEAGTWDPLEPITVTVRLPDGYRFDTARMIQYGRAVQTIDCRVRNGSVTVTVPPFGSYAVISFADADRLDRANKDLQRRREQDKAYVKRLARQKNLY